MAKNLMAALLMVASSTSFAFPLEARMSDLVTIENGSMLMSSYALCKVQRTTSARPETLQILFSMEAPAKGVISRDQFVAGGHYVKTMIEGRLASSHKSNSACKPLKSLIGEADISVKILMNELGMKMTVNSEKTGKLSETTLWEDFGAAF